MKLSNDHAHLAYAGSRGLIVVDAHTGKVFTRLPVNSADFTFSPHGNFLAVAETILSADKTRYESAGLHIFRLTGGAEVASFKPAGITLQSPMGSSWAVSGVHDRWQCCPFLEPECRRNRG